MQDCLFIKFVSEKKNQGIALPSKDYERKEIRTSTFADDTTVFVKTRNCIIEIIDMFDEFSKLSGLAVNHAKSVAVLIGSLKINNLNGGNINWKLAPNNAIKMTLCFIE